MGCYFPWYDGDSPRPCRKCAYCIDRRLNNWVFRCIEELKVSDSGSFVTLTYEVPPLTDNNMPTLRKTDFQNFMKRLRKTTNRKIKYYMCGEYGDTYYRPHYHAIIFNSSPEAIEKCWQGFTNLGDPEGVVLGITHFGEVNQATIAYTAKYMNKQKKIPVHFNDLRLPEYQAFSNEIGISFLSTKQSLYYGSDP